MPLKKEDQERIEKEGHNDAQSGVSRAKNPYDLGTPMDGIDSLFSTFLGKNGRQEKAEAWDKGHDKFKK